ncbi:6,7-dimethyl-8-ribityllumazine synthase [Citricoccus sp.]|uniref:6,7-dimethyl-8-ribityllumazine synthase n=1 Tax=Citricoccus sp. TaxID=1978372 RepID=UPI0028BD7875|nr:6,7-dimethyl-8-ribityllumazine synthase [Citricoccus sp.]
MSGHGAPQGLNATLGEKLAAPLPAAAGATDAKGPLRVAVVAAQWHEQVMEGLLAGARRAAADVVAAAGGAAGATARPGIEVVEFRVPGTFELPVAAARLTPRFDAVVALGVVIRGGTPHFDYVCSGATQGLVDVSVRTGTPIGFGVLTCDTEVQALDRAGLEGSREDKGYEAFQAAVLTELALR